MLRSAHLLLSPRHSKSRLLDRLPLCRRRYFDAGTLASIAILSSFHLSSDLFPISQKKFFGLHSASFPPTMNSSNEDSSRNKLMEDLLYVSDLDFREETPSSEPCAGYGPSQHLVEALAGISEDEDAAFMPFESDEATGGLQKRVLPEELAKAVMHLECESSVEGGHCDVYLVGTAHVSQDSCTEVQAVIRYLKPQAVFLELCSSRITILTPQNLKKQGWRELQHYGD
ncbi:hypothetical protein HPP92_017052 [Vanilla planifolia]|uniref:TraB domain-containing protein n=1 Tax=Vanilla planifolia TaxID=51239 RepID=A0A835QFX6_VANPL|nr:hypothetical protein HPP92_017052 [Vanilla planifolia]